MKYSDIKATVLANFAISNKLVPFIEGAPGGGKSSLARDIVKALGVKPEHTTEFNPSLRDPVDIMGVPDLSGEYSKWKPSEELYRLRDTDDDEPRALIIEELTDAQINMQNPLCRVILDRHAGELKLHHNMFIICTGNRTSDKSGATRMTTKLGNRMQHLTFDENIDDWSAWALENGIKPEIIQFLRFKTSLFSNFDPNRKVNPTPRSWEMVNYVSTAISEADYVSHVAGCVGEGAAAEFVGFKRIMDRLPNMDTVLLNPKTCEIPTDPATLFAFTGALAHRTTEDNFDRVREITDRMPPEFSVMTVKDALQICPNIKKTKAFTAWAVKSSSVLM